jgi:predicted hotdog family 3-hydroxylacyl-ACP dehydratase
MPSPPILTLPMAAQQLLPHRPPMLLVDALIDFSDGRGTVVSEVRRDDLFVNDDGTLEAVAMIELIAQGYAAIKGYEDTRDGVAVRQGYLVGARKVSMLAKVYVGDRLTIDVDPSGHLEGFSVVDGVIRRGEEIVAEGSLKLWITD